MLQHKQDRTILVSTHYMDEAEILCDQIAILHRWTKTGRQRQEDKDRKTKTGRQRQEDKDRKTKRGRQRQKDINAILHRGSLKKEGTCLSLQLEYGNQLQLHIYTGIDPRTEVGIHFLVPRTPDFNFMHFKTSIDLLRPLNSILYPRDCY